MVIRKDTALSFDDVSLVDGHSSLESRSAVSLSQRLGDLVLGLPVALASMTSVCSPEMAREFLKAGGMYVHHRYCSVDDRLRFMEDLAKKSFVGNEQCWVNMPVIGTAVGLEENTVELAELAEYYDLISLDVASANNERVLHRIVELADVIEDSATPCLLMVGNFSDYSYVWSLGEYEVLDKIDLLKVSQGGGSVCSTRKNIGVGVPTFQAVVDLCKVLRSVSGKVPKIVADGGVKTTGDMVKAYGAGASLVMCGGLFAGYEECPGTLVTIDGKSYKEFNGMASEKEKKKGHRSLCHIEGVTSFVEAKGSVADFLTTVRENIQSGIATAGHDTLDGFVGEGRFVKVTSKGHTEGTPHVEGFVPEH